MLNINQCDSNFNKIPAFIEIKQSHETATPQSISLHLITSEHKCVEKFYITNNKSPLCK